MNIQDVAKHLRKRAQHLHEAGISNVSSDYLEMAEACERFTWRPIETAPRDGLPRLYLCNGRIVQGFVDATGLLTVQDECGWRAMRRNPTHWMPLPEAPQP